MNIARYLKLLYHYSFYKGMVLAGLYDREFGGMGSFPKIPYAKIEQCNRKKTKVRPKDYIRARFTPSISGRSAHFLRLGGKHKHKAPQCNPDSDSGRRYQRHPTF